MNTAIIIPAYNESQNLCAGIHLLMEQMKKDELNIELILVDDGSIDSTWDEIQKIHALYPETICVKLSRNFGKEAAIFAGIAQVKADRCLVMDADMQHPPRVIRELIEAMDETGADIVEGVKKSRGKENIVYKLLAKGFYWCMHLFGGVCLSDSSDFKLFNRKVIDTLSSYKESTVFFRGLMEWSGFDRVQVPFYIDERIGGKSSFSSGLRFKFAMNSILSYTGKPLLFILWTGVLFLLCAAVLGVHTLVRYFTGQAIGGFTTVIVLLLVIGSMIMLSLGIIGAYISRIYNEVKMRPRYIISDCITNKNSVGISSETQIGRSAENLK